MLLNMPRSRGPMLLNNSGRRGPYLLKTDSPESFSKSVTLLAASVATGVHRQFPGQDLHLLGKHWLITAHFITPDR